jgi:hypothetical protein
VSTAQGKMAWRCTSAGPARVLVLPTMVIYLSYRAVSQGWLTPIALPDAAADVDLNKR